MPFVVESWTVNTAAHGALSSGLRHATLGAYVGRNYAEKIHLDGEEVGPTVGWRCSLENPDSPKAHLFVHPAMICKGKHNVIIKQPVGTVTLWKATEYQHTSSVDEPAYVKMKEHKTKSDDPVSIGLVIVQKRKLLSVLRNRDDVLSQFYSVEVLQAYNSVDASNVELVGSSSGKKRKVKGEKGVQRKQNKR